MAPTKKTFVTTTTALLLVVSAVGAMVIPLPPRSDTIIISPSVAKANLLALEIDLAAAVDGGAEWLHFSVQDGRMVPKISFGAPVVAACRKAFPRTVLDVKLGIIEPEHRIDDFVKAGADILSVHPESTLQLGAVIQMIDAAGVAPGVVLNPGTPVAAVEHVLDHCQVAVVMLVRACYYYTSIGSRPSGPVRLRTVLESPLLYSSHQLVYSQYVLTTRSFVMLCYLVTTQVNPGYGGPKYLKQAIDKIQQLRALQPDLHISVDGGVNQENAPALIAAGANVLVAGGGIFKADDKQAAIRALQDCCATRTIITTPTNTSWLL
jgi:pentose-5-phosphate-3-epimerase